MITNINEFKQSLNESISSEDKLVIHNLFKTKYSKGLSYKEYVSQHEEDAAQREIDHFLDGFTPDHIDFEDAQNYVYGVLGWL